MATTSGSRAVDNRKIQDQEVYPYYIASKIGKGSFATVYKGHHRQSGKAVAIKTVSRSILTRKLLDNLESEISILNALSNIHVVELKQVIKAPRSVYLIMEYCSGGDLSQYIRQRGKVDGLAYTPRPGAAPQYWPHPTSGGLDFVVVRSLLHQLAHAMKFLRDRNLIHRDIKPQNLLLEHSTVANTLIPLGVPLLKIADFGFARNLPKAALADTLCGSPLYMAPEILRFEKYDAKADLWSMGAVVYEMSVGKPPFRAANHIELLKRIERARGNFQFPDEVPASPEEAEKVTHPVPPEIKTLIRMLLKARPVERASFAEFFACDAVKGGFEATEVDDRGAQSVPPATRPPSIDQAIRIPHALKKVEDQLVIPERLQSSNSFDGLRPEKHANESTVCLPAPPTPRTYTTQASDGSAFATYSITVGTKVATALDDKHSLLLEFPAPVPDICGARAGEEPLDESLEEYVMVDASAVLVSETETPASLGFITAAGPKAAAAAWQIGRRVIKATVGSRYQTSDEANMSHWRYPPPMVTTASVASPRPRRLTTTRRSLTAPVFQSAATTRQTTSHLYSHHTAPVVLPPRLPNPSQPPGLLPTLVASPASSFSVPRVWPGPERESPGPVPNCRPPEETHATLLSSSVEVSDVPGEMSPENPTRCTYPPSGSPSRANTNPPSTEVAEGTDDVRDGTLPSPVGVGFNHLSDAEPGQDERSGNSRSKGNDAVLLHMEDIAQKAQVLKDFADRKFARVECAPPVRGGQRQGCISLREGGAGSRDGLLSPLAPVEKEQRKQAKLELEKEQNAMEGVALYMTAMAFSQKGVDTLNKHFEESIEGPMDGSGKWNPAVDRALFRFGEIFKACAERSTILQTLISKDSQSFSLRIDQVVFEHALFLMRQAASKELVEDDEVQIARDYKRALSMLYAMIDDVIQGERPDSKQDLEAISGHINEIESRMRLSCRQPEESQGQSLGAVGSRRTHSGLLSEQDTDSRTQTASSFPSDGSLSKTIVEAGRPFLDRDSYLVDLPQHPPVADGGFCELYVGIHCPSQTKLAMKRLKVLFPTEDMLRQLKRFCWEAQMWSTLDHANILPFFGAMKIDQQMYLVSPWMSLGDLLTFVEIRRQQIDQHELAENQASPSLHPSFLTFKETVAVREIATGIDYLHSLGVVHGDIKARNVLLDDNGRVQICDFGLTKTLDHCSTSTGLKGVGSIRWQSPEILQNNPKSTKSDVYAFGLTISEILTTNYPFPHLKDPCAVIVAIIINNERPMSQPISRLDVDFQPLWDLAARCWTKEVDQRPTMGEVLEQLDVWELQRSLSD